MTAVTLPHAAVAQQYPNRDIRFICAFPPGSGADVLVRFFAEQLRPIANRTIIVENRAGAGGNIATEHVARAKPDGYTIFVHAGSAVAAGLGWASTAWVGVGLTLGGLLIWVWASWDAKPASAA